MTFLGPALDAGSTDLYGATKGEHWGQRMLRRLLLAALVMATGLPVAAAAAPAAAETPPPRYGPPEWLPLRSAASVGCTFQNCSGTNGRYHPYWAIDFLDPQREPGHD